MCEINMNQTGKRSIEFLLQAQSLLPCSSNFIYEDHEERCKTTKRNPSKMAEQRDK
jgi:hypothetical protein